MVWSSSPFRVTTNKASATISSGTYGDVSGLANLDISTLVAGVPYTLAITGVQGSDEVLMASSTYFATEDLDFLTIFGQVRRGSAGIAALRGYTALVTRDNEGF